MTTWPPEAWKIGGGTVWGWIAYDPELNLIYYGTGNPGPWNAEQRPGDNKWTAGIFARDPDTGAAKWFYQYQPARHARLRRRSTRASCSTCRSTARRARCCVHPDRNGYLYVIDRMTGEVLSADPYGYVNSIKGVDLKTGRLIVNPDKPPQLGKVVRDICPTASGRQGLEPVGLLAAHRPDLHPAREHLHGLERRAGELHRRHALRRRRRA